METTVVSLPSTKSSVIDCCLNVDSTDVDLNGQHQLNILLSSLEIKFECYLKNIQTEFNVKCEAYDTTIAEISKELAETKEILKARNNSHDLIADAKMTDHNSSVSCSTLDENDDLPRTLQFHKDHLRKKNISDSDSNTAEGIGCLPIGEASNRLHEPHESSSSYDDTTVTPASIEQLIRKELRSYMKEVMAEREAHTYMIQREIEKQNQQLAQLRIDVMSRLRVLDLSAKQPKDHNLEPIPLHCMTFDVTEVEIELIEEGKFTPGKMSKPNARSKPENQLALVQKIEDPLVLFTSQVCTNIIRDEAEHLMRTWGTQFDDLTVYLQDHLDKQSECIAESQRSTFEHVDAETQTRTGILNAQFTSLGRKSHQQEKEIQEVREEQERSFHVVVETLIKLKTKYEGICEKIKDHEEMHSSFEIDVSLIRQDFNSELKSWQSKFSQYEGKLHLLKGNVDHVLKEVESVIEDRESIQTVLSATIELFNSKMETSNGLWKAQLTALELRFNRQIEAGQLQIKKMNHHKHETDLVITAICKKLVNLTTDVGKKQGVNVDDLLQHGEIEDDRFKYIKLDQKKYKRALWCAQQQRSNVLLVEKPKKEIEFYDLTLAETKSNE